MESKNEPKTLEEANYNERIECCEVCRHYDEYKQCSKRHGFCGKFYTIINLNGVCDCYE